jgi:hypothetical protein
VGVPFGGRGRVLSCTCHGCPGIIGVSSYPIFGMPCDSSAAPADATSRADARVIFFNVMDRNS